MRRCVICGQEKEDEFFIHDKYAKDGIRNVCLECNKKRARMQRATIKKHLEELEKKLNNYVQITSISIDMSTEETPYNRIYAKPIEKQGDILLCEFESANYDINKKGKDFTTGISEEMYLDQLKVKENMIKSYQEENTKLKEKIVKMKDIVLNTETNNMKSIIEIVNTAKENAQLKELLKECRDVIKNVDTYYGNYDSTNGYLVINKIDEALK